MTAWPPDAARPFRWKDLERVTDAVRLRASACGDVPLAVDLGNGRLLAGELDRAANALAADLDHLFPSPGLVVARIPNCLTAVVAVVGVLRSRHALVMVHPELPSDSSLEMLRRLRPVAELTLNGIELEIVPMPFGPPQPIWQAPNARPDLGIALCVLTSGTTGRPRLIAAPHRQVLTATRLIDARLKYRSDDVVPVVSPLSFDYGLYQLFLTFVAGATAVIDPRMTTVSNLLVAVARAGSTVLPLVPTMLRAVATTPLVRRVDTSRVRLVTTTGDLLTEEDARNATAAFPNAVVLPMYGLSECKRVAITPLDANRPPGAVGIRLDGTDVAVNAHGMRVRAGTVGELVVAGPHLTFGYLADEAATAKRFTVDGRSGARLLHTGDRLRIDENGWLYWSGRSKDLIKTSGYRIDAAEIETAAAQSGVVAESGAYGRLDPTRGQVPVLRVRLHDDVPPDTGRATVVAALERALPSWAMPQIEVSAETLPHTVNGKVDRGALYDASWLAAEATPDQPEWLAGPLAATATFPRSGNLISCHTQAMLSGYDMSGQVTASLFELATTVPFGVQTRPDDPNRILTPWLDPDLGLDRAADILGLRTQTCWHDNADAAVTQLDQWLRTTPVVLGPLDLGGLTYHVLADTLRGCDHYVVVLGRSMTGHFVLCDPEGHVQVELEEQALCTAWAASDLPEGRGKYMLRRTVPGDPVAPSEVVARIAAAATANLAASARAENGGAACYRTLAGLDPDPSGRRGLSLLLPATAARHRLAARFADVAAMTTTSMSYWRHLATLWDAQVRTLALAHHALLSGGPFADLMRDAARLDERLTDVAANGWKASAT